MVKPKYHIFVCSSSRITGQQKGFCRSKSSVDIVMNFMEEIAERGLGGEIIVSNTGCLGVCEMGPIVIVYPDNVWYGSVTSDDVDEIMDEHVGKGRVVGRLAI
ncbi:MAG: 2Fe-2S ferredoxin [Bacillota bacterium]